MIEPNRTVTVEPENPSNPSLGPDPLAFENNVIPCSSNAQISDPRSIALPIMACLLRSDHSEFDRNDSTDPQFVELFVAARHGAACCRDHSVIRDPDPRS